METALIWIVLIIMSGIVALTSVVYRAKGRSIVAPEHVLKARFANGEIGEEEYVRRLAVLQHDRLRELDG